MGRVVVALAAIALMTGCSSGGEPTPTPDPVETAAAAPTVTAPAEEGATVEQGAGLVAVEQMRVDEAQESWESAVCSSLAAEEPDCGALLYIMSATAATTSITLGGGANPDGPTYLGSPPDEVADLITDTLAAAAAAMTAGEDVDCPGENCVGTSFAFTRAWDALREALTRWSPYI